MPEHYLGRARQREMEMSEIDARLGKLLEEEPDPRTKAMLLLMQQMNHNLNETTYATCRISEAARKQAEAFEAYSKRFDAYVNRGLGGWKVGTVLLGIINVAIGAAMMTLWTGYQAMSATLTTVQISQSVMESRFNNLDANQRWMMDQILAFQRRDALAAGEIPRPPVVR